MPVHEVSPGRWRWGKHGKIGTKAQAEAQARAIYASGYREDAARRKAARILKASPRAEAAYVLDLVRIMRETTRAVLVVVERERLSPAPLREDAKLGLGGPLTRRLFTWQRERVQLAFDRMGHEVDKKAATSMALVGISPRHIAGVESQIDHFREANVGLIRTASQDFMDQVDAALEETEGMHVEAIRKALEDRADVASSRAQLIARNETLKLNSQVIESRQRSAGVDSYQWSGSLDERERDTHRMLEGYTIRWDEPGDQILISRDLDDSNEIDHAGRYFQCRCVPVPIIEGLEDILPEPEGAGEGEPDEE